MGAPVEGVLAGTNKAEPYDSWAEGETSVAPGCDDAVPDIGEYVLDEGSVAVVGGLA